MPCFAASARERMLLAKKESGEPTIIPHFSAHVLRHTFCTRLCENETNVKVIIEIMGYSEIQTTMNIYAKATGQKLQESMSKISDKILV